MARDYVLTVFKSVERSFKQNLHAFAFLVLLRKGEIMLDIDI
jgi:hypothetical protein